MNNLNIGRIALSIFGSIFIIVGILYSKESHRKADQSFGAYGDFCYGIIGAIIAVLPWYVAKSFFILMGMLSFFLFIISFFFKMN
jgi:hypothetical protein